MIIDMTDLQSVDLRGLWVPVVTPFTKSGTIDTDGLARVANRLLRDGAAGLVALGTTGEPATLSADERRLVVEVCAASCRASKRPLIVGAGTNSTQGTIDEIETLNAHDELDAALVVVPYYTRPSESAVVDHFKLVADASAVPIVMYNIPYRTGRGLGAAAIVELATDANIIGLKQAVGNLDQDTLAILGDGSCEFAVLAGDDAFICPSVLMGASGAIAAAAHLCTPLFVEMIDAAMGHDVARAVHLAKVLLPVVDTGFSEPSPATWKGVLHRTGEISSSQLRRPMTMATPEVVEELIAHILRAHHDAEAATADG